MTVRTIDDIFRDFVIDGVPASGPFNPHKPDIRDTLKKLIEGISTFPDNRVIRLNNANEGTANNIVVTSSVTIPAAAYQVLYVLNVTQENTGAVIVSGAINRSLITNTSQQLAAGYITPGMAVLCVDTGTALRMLSYGDVESVVEDMIIRAEAARDAAELARDQAQNAASDAVSQSNVPIYSTRNAVEGLVIPTGIHAFRTNGFSVVGDGGHALYKWVSSEPAHAGKVQSADGAWWELAENVVNPLMFGAVGDNVTLDNDGLEGCFLTAVALNRSVKLMSKQYLASRRINIPRGISIFGEGMNNSIIRWGSESTSWGISVTLESGNFRDILTVKDFSLFCGATTALVPGVDGLSVRDTTPADRITPSVIATNIRFSGSINPNVDGWYRGLNLDGCHRTFVDGCHFIGKVSEEGAPNYDSEYGIFYSNASGAAPHPTECHIYNCTFGQVITAIHADDMEGLMVYDNQIVGVNVGVHAVGLLGFPHVSVKNNHINASNACVIIDKMYEGIIEGNLLYSQLHVVAGTGIQVTNSARFFTISNNTFENYSNVAAQNSVVVGEGNAGLITGNLFRRTNSSTGSPSGVGIWLTSNATGVFVSDDNIFSDIAEVTTPIINSGSGNRVPATPWRIG